MIVLKVVPYETHHLDAVCDREDTGTEATIKHIKESNGPAWTFIDGETIIGCGGLIVAWPGVGIVWSALSEDISRYGIALTKIAKRTIIDSMRAFELHRIEATVIAGNEKNIQWLRLLGFGPENGIARCYTSNRQDAVRFELVRD